MIEFKTKPHALKPGDEMVEVVIDGRVSAAIYARDFEEGLTEISLVSRHISSPPNYVESRYPIPSAVFVRLKRQD